MHTSATIQNWNPETGSVKSTLKFAKVPWVKGKWSRQKLTHNWLLAVLGRPGDPIYRRIWYWLDTVDRPVRRSWTSRFSAVWSICVFRYANYSLPGEFYTTSLCRTIWDRRTPLTIPGSASTVVWSWYCCPVVFQYFEGDYPPCQSTWRQAVVEIDSWAPQWILWENTMRSLIMKPMEQCDTHQRLGWLVP